MENIFELNNQVFGLNFRERRVSSKTRRAMKSEFVTPVNSVDMTYDDVCDVNGGGFTLFSWMVSAPIDIALMAFGATAAFGGIKLLGKTFGKALAAKLSTSIAPIIANIIGTISGGLLNIAVGQLGSWILGAFWALTSLGGIVGFVLDVAFDGNYDGVIYRW